jgi:RHS repeat-associated protein
MTGNVQQQSYGLSNRLQSYLERDEKLNLIPNNCKLQKGGLEYDAVGRLLEDPSNCNTKYSWDAEGNLIKVQYDANNWTQIYWNGSKQWTRIVEVVNGSPKDDKTYVWTMGGYLPTQIRDTLTGKLLTSFNGDGYQNYQYDEWGNISTEAFIMLRDHQGSVIGLTNQQGQQIEAIEYDDWGNITKRQTLNPTTNLMDDVSTARTNTRNLPIQYAGYFFLKRADLALTPHRAYHPKIKRWLTRDPIAEMGGDNVYAYVLNNPVAFVDASGLVPRDPARCMDLLNELEDITNRGPALERLASRQFEAIMQADSSITERTIGQWARAYERGGAARSQLSPSVREMLATQHQVYTMRNRARQLVGRGVVGGGGDLRNACGDDDDNGPGGNARASAVIDWAIGRVSGMDRGRYNRAAAASLDAPLPAGIWPPGMTAIGDVASNSRQPGDDPVYAALAFGRYPDGPRDMPIPTSGVSATTTAGAGAFASAVGFFVELLEIAVGITVLSH